MVRTSTLRSLTFSVVLLDVPESLYSVMTFVNKSYRILNQSEFEAETRESKLRLAESSFSPLVERGTGFVLIG